MKCIYCYEDTNYPERKANGGCCKKCGHRFAFEPREENPGVTDKLFLHAYESVSGGGTIACTERQLWYELNRMMSWGPTSMPEWMSPGISTPGESVGFALVMIVGSWVMLILVWNVGNFFLSLDWVGKVAVVLVVCVVVYAIVNYYRRWNKHRIKLNYELFRSGNYIETWAKIHQPLDKVLPPPTLDALIAARDVEPELFNYSFDRVLVTDQAETAAMLVANNFHFEYNCAILSADGYPPGTAATVMMMLRRNPKLQAFALHDAAVEGCRLPLLLRTESWFPQLTVTVLDLGMRPRHAQARRMIILHGPSTVVADELATLLSPHEIEWLARGNRAEIAAIRPQRLMRIVAYGIAQAAQLREDAWATGKEEADSPHEATSEPDHRGWRLADVLTGLAVILHLRDDPGPLEKETDSIWKAEGELEEQFRPDTFG